MVVKIIQKKQSSDVITVIARCGEMKWVGVSLSGMSGTEEQHGWQLIAPSLPPLEQSLLFD